MVHTLPVKRQSAMLNIAEELGIRNARRNGLGPYRTRNNSRGSSAEETAAGQCRRLAGHGPVRITGGDQSRGGRVALSGRCAHLIRKSELILKNATVHRRGGLCLQSQCCRQRQDRSFSKSRFS